MRLTVAFLELKEACIQKAMQPQTRLAVIEAWRRAKMVLFLAALFGIGLLPSQLQLWASVCFSILGCGIFVTILMVRICDSEYNTISEQMDKIQQKPDATVDEGMPMQTHVIDSDDQEDQSML